VLAASCLTGTSASGPITSPARPNGSLVRSTRSCTARTGINGCGGMIHDAAALAGTYLTTPAQMITSP
jgi:hypothetical protein